MKNKIIISIGILFIVIVLFLSARMVFCPKMLPMESTEFSNDELETVSEVIDSNIITMQSMADNVSDKKIILAGEIHFQEKVMEKFIEFLSLLPVNSFILTLELPSSIQPEISNFMETGDVQYLEKLKECGNCLPYWDIIKWCYKNKTKAIAVYAIDENRTEIVIKRAFCMDSRNETMTNKIIEIQKKYESVPVVFYGGQLHCIQSGRYLYDVENRTPLGSRLLNEYSKNDLTTIIFTANKRFVSYEAWVNRVGVLPINNSTRMLERRYFIHEPVIGSNYSGDFFDYFVNVGDL